MRVCDTHEDARMCADTLCNRKMCVRQMSVCRATVGPQLECGRRSLCATRFRISGRRLGMLQAACGRICGVVPFVRSKVAANGLPSASFFISFRVRVPRAASMEGPLCGVMYGTKSWVKFSQLRHLDHFAPHHQSVEIVEVGGFHGRWLLLSKASSRTKDSTTRPCRWLQVSVLQVKK